MANKQHVDITDPDIHEPKGVATALANMVYVSSGSGSGVWKKASSTLLQGLTGDGGVPNLKPLTDGAGGFKLVTDAGYGSMVMNGNTNAFTLAAATDPALNSNSDYQLFSGTGAPWLAGANLSGVAFGTDRLTVATSGVYRIDFWASISSFPTTTAKVSVKNRVNGSAFSTRHPVVKSSVAGDIGSLHSTEFLSLNAGDYVQLMAASSGAGGLIISDASYNIQLLRAT